MTRAERHSLVPPGPAAPSVATIVWPRVRLWLGTCIFSLLSASLQDPFSLAQSARDNRWVLSQPRTLRFCVLLISGALAATIIGRHSMPADASAVGPVTLPHGNDTQYFVLHAAWADIC